MSQLVQTIFLTLGRWSSRLHYKLAPLLICCQNPEHDLKYCIYEKSIR
jgi:hypothetical protein